MATLKQEGDMWVTGTLVAGSLVAPASSVNNASVVPGAGISASKLQQQYELTYGQSGTAASVTIPIHVVRGATASLQSICVGSVAVAVGAATVTVDLKKNGTTCLSGVVTLDNANTVYVPVSGTITVDAATVGQVYTLVI